MSLARFRGEAVAAHIQMVHGDAAYAHLAAANDVSRKLGASYALYYAEIEYFADKVRWIDWGGEAGLAKDGSLSSFKRGWSTDEYGQFIFVAGFSTMNDMTRSQKRKAPISTGYFPAYRAGEFN